MGLKLELLFFWTVIGNVVNQGKSNASAVSQGMAVVLYRVAVGLDY